MSRFEQKCQITGQPNYKDLKCSVKEWIHDELFFRVEELIHLWWVFNRFPNKVGFDQ